MAKLTEVYCTYTGGNIYVCTAKYGAVYLVCDFEQYGTYDVPYDDIEEKYDCDYDSHWKDSPDPLPTWQELLDAIRESYESGVSTNMDMSEVEGQIRYLHPDLSIRIDEDDRKEPADHADSDDQTCIGMTVEDVYDRLCFALTDYESSDDDGKALALYNSIVDIVNDIAAKLN